jgi:hypothetical protein
MWATTTDLLMRLNGVTRTFWHGGNFDPTTKADKLPTTTMAIANAYTSLPTGMTMNEGAFGTDGAPAFGVYVNFNINLNRCFTLGGGSDGELWYRTHHSTGFDAATGRNVGDTDLTDDWQVWSRIWSTANFDPATKRDLTNGNFTTDVSIRKATPFFEVAATAGTAGYFGFARWNGSAASPRWSFSMDDDAEAGGDQGATFMFDRYSDAGAYTGSPLKIRRADGLATFERRPTWVVGGVERQPWDAENFTPADHGGVDLYLIDATTGVGVRLRNGGRIIISGTSRQAASATLAPASFTLDVISYVYAYWTGSAVAYEISTTAHATHTNGVEIKSGDASRTFIGAVFRSSAYGLRDDFTMRLVRSWFRHPGRPLKCFVTYPSYGSATGSTLAIPNTAIYFITFPGEVLTVRNFMSFTCNVANKLAIAEALIDGVLSGYQSGHLHVTSVGFYGNATGMSWNSWTTTRLSGCSGAVRLSEHAIFTASVFGTVEAEIST